MFRVGDYVKILPERKNSTWYHPEKMQITAIDGQLLLVDYQFHAISESDQHCIAVAHLFQDQECIRFSRLDKLKRIKNEN